MILLTEVYAGFKTAWDTYTPSITGGTVPPVRYDGERSITRPLPAVTWVEARSRLDDASQISLANDTGIRLFKRSGKVELSIRVPTTQTFGALLVDVAKQSFQGQVTPGGVRFRNVRAIEVGLDGPWFQWDVVADFEYDELV